MSKEIYRLRTDFSLKDLDDSLRLISGAVKKYAAKVKEPFPSAILLGPDRFMQAEFAAKKIEGPFQFVQEILHVAVSLDGVQTKQLLPVFPVYGVHGALLIPKGSQLIFISKHRGDCEEIEVTGNEEMQGVQENKADEGIPGGRD